MKANLKLIEELSNAYGPAGFEDEVVNVVKSHVEPFGEVTEDKMRNLYVSRKENTGDRPVVMIDAHTDEVGFIVQYITAKGVLKILPLGGWNTTNVLGHKYKVRVSDGSFISGILGTTPPHFQSAPSAGAPRIEDMYLDVGASSYDEAVNIFGVEIGAPVVPDTSFELIRRNNRMIGKAFDCRVGCASLVEVLQNLEGDKLNVDVVASFSVQEEAGLRGAKVTSQTIKPDVAIVLEGSPADDVLFDKYRAQAVLGNGAQIRHFDRSMIANPRFIKFATNLADQKGINYQQTVRSGGGTNGGSIHLANSGVPTLVVAVPTRYIHTHHGIASIADYEDVVELVTNVIKNLTKEVIESL